MANDGADVVAPQPITTRGYQQELLEESLHRNIVIALDTGSGKTHIAILRMKHEVERNSRKVSIVCFGSMWATNVRWTRSAGFSPRQSRSLSSRRKPSALFVLVLLDSFPGRLLQTSGRMQLCGPRSCPTTVSWSQRHRSCSMHCVTDTSSWVGISLCWSLTRRTMRPRSIRIMRS